ncbi:GYDIA family GHMP kinase [Flavobacterium humi]|uniref:GHMP kinase n=1 Tax=Flavobacterium humi TaxID=2562683 RepID=A0A4Z0L5U6_9FLAO|nr:GYDIA family GHMP kinase [Flavobacterium humi]TGD57343.1 GHMP kinase [Flavobacterium humi]
MKKTFYSNGKLLLTAEYVVLDGAKALALPTKYGQNMVIEEGSDKTIQWKSFDADGSIWFESAIPFAAIIAKDKPDTGNAIQNTLTEILHQAYLLAPDFIIKSDGYHIQTTLTFPKFWGLGTSSTLINNIAQWLAIDAYTLLRNSFGGSGYDIACAQNDFPITYQLIDGKPIVHPADFKPAFTDKIYFVYLNKKQNSRTAIANYYNKQGDITKLIPKINQITETVLQATHPKEFALELQKHEIELSNFLEMQTAKEALFPDFDGVIKSLGAWGGDFILAISKQDPVSYFKDRGYGTVIPYEEMIL